MEKSEKIARGEELLRRMGGDAHMKGREERARLFPDMNELILGTVYGEIWHRPALDKRSRSLCMVAIALGMPENQQNLRLHIRGALTNGLSKEEILKSPCMLLFMPASPRLSPRWGPFSMSSKKLGW